MANKIASYTVDDTNGNRVCSRETETFGRVVARNMAIDRAKAVSGAKGGVWVTARDENSNALHTVGYAVANGRFISKRISFSA